MLADSPRPGGRPRTELVLSAVLVILAIPVHLAGLFVPSLYRDPALLIPQNLGTDLVTVGVMIPLFAFAAAAMRRSAPARLLWLGALGYFVYAYGMYALGVHWNRLFLAYVALLGVSFYALVFGLARTNAAELAAALTPRAPRRAASIYLVSVATLVGLAWLLDELRATWTGVAPASLAEFEAPTNIVHVFDLGLVLPALVLASVLLHRRRAWGDVLAGALLVMTTAIGLWILALIGFSTVAGYPGPLAPTFFFALLTLIGIAVAWRYLAAFGPTLEIGAIAGFVPEPEFRDRHEIDVHAPADVVFEVAERFDLMSVPAVRAIVRMREWFMGSRGHATDDHRPFIANARDLGWGLLTARPEREIVMGAECRPWLADVTFEPVPSDRFTADATPDRVKIAWSVETHALAPARTRLVSETRVVSTDAAARAKFRRYWRWSRFGIVAIRLLILPAMRREAEEIWRERSSGAPGTFMRPVEPRNAHALPR